VNRNAGREVAPVSAVAAARSPVPAWALGR
jgi:hypothetical protein